MQKYGGFLQLGYTDTLLYVFIIALAIFILGVQIGIKHGRELQKEDFQIEYGYCISD